MTSVKCYVFMRSLPAKGGHSDALLPVLPSFCPGGVIMACYLTSSIPGSGGVESLNVASAIAVLPAP